MDAVSLAMRVNVLISELNLSLLAPKSSLDSVIEEADEHVAKTVETKATTDQLPPAHTVAAGDKFNL